MSLNTSVVKTKNEVIGVGVKNTQKEDLGKIEEVMLDKSTGRAAYVVLASGGFLGMGDKFFAIPWNSIRFDNGQDCFVLNVDKETLKKAPGFDKDNWPDMANKVWGQTISTYYGQKPYWEQ